MSAIDYNRAILLDAEDLAEGGVRSAYERVIDASGEHLSTPMAIVELLDPSTPSYSVSAAGVTYDIFSNVISSEHSWGRATFALFDIINRQLRDTGYLFYALNGGNDLAGVFLTVAEYRAAVKSLKRKTDWPYIPTHEGPWFGQPH